MVQTKFQQGVVNVPANTFGYHNKKLRIIFHQTGNTDIGAGAQRHANLQSNGYGVRAEASWHWQVDDKIAIQSYPHTLSLYHASDGRGTGNMDSIAIEMCINADGDYNKAIQNSAELIAYICKLEGLNPLKDVYQHYDFARDKKNCPAQIRAGKNGYTWSVLLQMANKAYLGDKVSSVKPVTSISTAKAVAGIVKHYAENGTFTANRTINVRTAPSTQAKVRAQYKAGETVKYSHVHIGNGYVWIEYLSVNGVTSYMAIRDYDNGIYGPLWGTIDDKGATASIAASKSTGIVGSYKESGVFYPNDTIIVRDKASTAGKEIARYHKGENVKYHTVHLGNRYVWLQYTRANGGQGYIPCRTYDGTFGELWGTIK